MKIEYRRPRFRPAAVVFLCALGLNACASDNASKVAWAVDKPAVTASLQHLKDVQQLGAEASRQQVEAFVALQSRVDALEEQNRQLHSQLEAEHARFDSLAERVESRHLNKTAKQKPVAAAVAVKKAPVAPVVPAVVRKVPVEAVAATPKVDQAAIAEAEKNAYTAAYLALKSGRFDEAANGFNAQLDHYPDGEYTDQAWYWLGEARFAQHDHARAWNAFKYVADHYANSVKHAAALLKLGQISEMQNHWQQAVVYYNRLIADHSDSTLAEQAREAIGRIQTRPADSGE